MKMKRIFTGVLCAAIISALCFAGGCAAQSTTDTTSANTSSTETMENSQIANPMVQYDTVLDAQEAAGFTVMVPSSLKDTEIEDVYVINGQLVQIDYVGDICYRIAKGSDDISGDSNEYASVQTLTAGSVSVTAKGDGSAIMLATWADGTYTYSVSFAIGVTADYVTELVNGLTEAD